MNNPFETLLESQKKAMDAWTEWTQNVTQGPKKQEPSDLLQEWYQQYQQLLQEGMNAQTPQEAFEKAPHQFQKWMELQQDFSQKWMKSMEQWQNPLQNMPGAEYLSTFMPKSSPDWTRHLDQWAEMMRPGNNWMRKSLLDRLPFVQQGHFLNFEQVYKELAKHWEDFQKMIQYGMFNQEMIDKYFSREAYHEFVSKFMGFQPIHHPHELVDKMSESFDQYFKNMEDMKPRFEEWTDTFQNHLTEMMQGNKSPMFQLALDMKKVIREGMDSGYNMAGTAREVQLARLMKEIQFGFGAFIVRSAELQTQVYEAGQFALPETLKHFYGQFSDSKQMPSYEDFFSHYINELENGIMDALESDNYSVTQSEVAKVGIQVKSNIDSFIELAFADFPFLMDSHADEVAKETHALRRKIRDLEARLRHMEQGAAPAANGQANGTANGKTSEQATLLAAIGKAQKGEKDDLKRIKGVGPKLEKALNTLGVYTYKQLACMTSREYKLLDELLDSFQGRARRDDWAGQAKSLIK